MPRHFHLLQPFGWPIVAYLTLAGIACGAGVVGSLLLLSYEPRNHRLGRRAIRVATLAIVAGAACLIYDLERPTRWYLILTQFNRHSIISWGSRLVGSFSLLAGFIALTTRLPVDRCEAPTGPARSKLLLVLLLLLALGVGTYPAFVLGQSAARPMWAGAWVAPHWLGSGLHGGLGGGLVVTMARQIADGEGPGGLGPAIRGILERIDPALIFVQAVLFMLFVYSLTGLPEAAVLRLLRGGLGLWFWIGLLLLGWLAPLIEMSRPSSGRFGLLMRGACVLIGAVSIRVLIVFGGQGSEAFIGG